jgi:hypothetical protein
VYLYAAISCLLFYYHSMPFCAAFLWVPLIKGSLNLFFCGRGFYAFPFEHKEDKDLIFRNMPYFLGARGMYLNKWTLDFNPKNDVLFVVLVWV